MTQSIADIERDIEQSRARLDLTIDRLQDKLTPTGIIDDVMGTVRVRQAGSSYDTALAVVRQNPVPVMLIAIGVGWLFYRMAKAEAHRAIEVRREPFGGNAGIPVLHADGVRGYDPDTSPLHPTHDTLENRRDLSAQA